MTFSSRLRRRWLWLLGILLVVVVVAAFAARNVAKRYLVSGLKARAIAVLEQRLESGIELGNLDVSVGRIVTLRGTGLLVRHHRRTDVPPLVEIREFHARATWADLLARPRRLLAVEIDAMRITVARGGGGVREDERGGCRGTRREAPDASRASEGSPFVARRLVAREARIVLLPSQPDKSPREFQVHDVVLHDFALDRAATFEARLSNPVPRGEISTRGEFGPWNPHDPAATPVRGKYLFSRVDLGTIAGLAGDLESTGAFEGPLRQITVRGETRTPRFGLSSTGNRLPLTTRFDACVDGTDGDTYLDRVEAKLSDTSIMASGRVEGRVGVAGRHVHLQVASITGRIEDLVRLAVDDASPLTGNVQASARLGIDPGPIAVARRMQLEGTFAIDDMKLTKGALQARIDELSRRGRGDVDGPPATAVRSRVTGQFAIAHGVLRIPAVRFAVPGAAIRLGGTYGLESGRLDFRGRVRLVARASEMVGGWKSWAVKPLDPLLARDGAGMIVPLSITGTRSAPEVRVDVRGTLFGERTVKTQPRR